MTARRDGELLGVTDLDGDRLTLDSHVGRGFVVVLTVQQKLHDRTVTGGVGLDLDDARAVIAYLTEAIEAGAAAATPPPDGRPGPGEVDHRTRRAPPSREHRVQRAPYPPRAVPARPPPPEEHPMQEHTPAERQAARPLTDILDDVARGRIAVGDLPRRTRRAVIRIARTDPLKDALARVRAAQLHEALGIVDDAFSRSAAAGDITAREATR